MTDKVTDGTSQAGGSTGSGDTWDSMLSEGIASTGIDPNTTLESLNDESTETPQGATTESSAGSQTQAPPAEPQSAPQPAPTGDVASPATEPEYPAGTKPFSYEVNGQSKQIEGAFHIPGEGLYIPEDKVAHFQLIASRADTLTAINQKQSQDYQALERATAWTQDGQTLTGAAALEAQRVYTAQASVALGVLLDVLKPENFSKYATVGQTGRFYDDGTPELTIVPNDREMALLKRQLELDTNLAAARARDNHSKASAPPPPAAPTAADYAAPTIESWVTAHSLTGLTEADKKVLIEDFPRFIVKEGNGLAVDPILLERAKERSQWRLDEKARTKAAESAGRFNAGMNGGKKPQPAQRPPAHPSPPQPAAKQSKNAAWDDLLTQALPEVLQGMG